MKTLGKLIEGVVKSSSITDPEFSECIRKWSRYLYSSANSLSKTLNISHEDAFNDLMLPLIRLYRDFYRPKFRYNKKVYDLAKDYGNIYLLRTSEFSQRKIVEFLIPVDKCVKVRKAKLTSQFFKKIQQEACVLARKKFTQKNGYVKVGTYKALTKIKGKNLFDSKYEIIVKNRMVKTMTEHRLEDVVKDHPEDTLADVLGLSKYSSEDMIEEFEMLNSFKNSLSNDALEVLVKISEDAKITDQELAKELGFSQRKIEAARREVEKHRKYLKGIKQPVSYAPYAIYQGDYYFLGTNMGEYQRLRLFSGEIVAPTNEVSIEKHLAIRKPFHFKASFLC